MKIKMSLKRICNLQFPPLLNLPMLVFQCKSKLPLYFTITLKFYMSSLLQATLRMVWKIRIPLN